MPSFIVSVYIDLITVFKAPLGGTKKTTTSNWKQVQLTIENGQWVNTVNQRLSTLLGEKVTLVEKATNQSLTDGYTLLCRDYTINCSRACDQEGVKIISGPIHAIVIRNH